MKRSHVLKAVLKRCPEIFPWMESCYAQHGTLFCGSTKISSERGLQQGDPCGPAGFAFGLQGLVERLERTVTWQSWYLDDGVILGSILQLQEVQRLIQQFAGQLGLELNRLKCRLWGPAVTLPPDTTMEDQFRKLGTLHGIPVERFDPNTGIKVLGIPVCHPLGDGFAQKVWASLRMFVSRFASVVADMMLQARSRSFTLQASRHIRRRVS